MDGQKHKVDNDRTQTDPSIDEQKHKVNNDTTQVDRHNNDRNIDIDVKMIERRQRQTKQWKNVDK